MRPTLVALFAGLALAGTPVLTVTLAAQAQSRSEREDDARRRAESEQEAKKKQKEKEWNTTPAPLPSVKNAGPCPYVKVLYDAARYVELKDQQETANAVGYTGEITGLRASCSYKGAEPIKLQVAAQFALGKGPQAQGDTKVYRYWVAVTARNQFVLAKQDFDLKVKFPKDQDRVVVVDTLRDIVIPRSKATVSGSNFEVLIGFDVTPEMAEFNRLGKRFRVNAAPQTTQTASAGGASQQQ